MEIDVAKVRKLINEILSGLERAKPSVTLPYDWYWEIQKPERYGGTKPDASAIDKKLLSNDWAVIEKVPAGVELLVQLSSLLRVIGDHPAEVLRKDNSK
jgi:hypothetical protein